MIPTDSTFQWHRIASISAAKWAVTCVVLRICTCDPPADFHSQNEAPRSKGYMHGRCMSRCTSNGPI